MINKAKPMWQYNLVLIHRGEKKDHGPAHGIYVPQ